MGGTRFVGLDNFRQAVEDTLLHDAFWNTFLYVAIGVALSVLVGFALALALAGQARRIRLVRTAVFLPAVVTVAVCAEVFRILYHPTPDGPLNTLLGVV